jgi:vacuolar iron transporter family protein
MDGSCSSFTGYYAQIFLFILKTTFGINDKFLSPPYTKGFRMFKEQKTNIEKHIIDRTNWLRAAVLGANDGVLSVASVISGMAAANTDEHIILLAGLASLIAGAFSMAAGEYVSVCSQSDIEKTNLAREEYELLNYPEEELEELAQIYHKRGLTTDLAREVAKQLMKKNALEAHARDELGISEITTAKPLQAAMASATSFVAGGIIPLFVTMIFPLNYKVIAVTLSSLFSLALLGALGAKASGSKILKPTFRVLVWGTISMLVTTLIGGMFNINHLT